MIEPRANAVTIAQPPNRASALNFFQAAELAVGKVGLAVGRVGVWAGDTAQQFGMLVAVLMGPAVFSAYAFAAWALASNLGWTDSFLFLSGPLSNWIIWLGFAVLINTAAAILKKHTRVDNRN